MCTWLTGFWTKVTGKCHVNLSAHFSDCLPNWLVIDLLIDGLTDWLTFSTAPNPGLSSKKKRKRRKTETKLKEKRWKRFKISVKNRNIIRRRTGKERDPAELCHPSGCYCLRVVRCDNLKRKVVPVKLGTMIGRPHLRSLQLTRLISGRFVCKSIHTTCLIYTIV